MNTALSLLGRGLARGLILPLALLLLASAQPAFARYADMVVDAETGEVLHATNADVRNYPASLTKMMTLYLLFDALDRGDVHMGDRMPVSAHAAAQAPSKLGLEEGDSLKVEEAILGMCTKSANDAAVTVAEYLGGSEPAFAEMMTRKARELGMSQTVFHNASGLPTHLEQQSTARDMVTLARALLRNHAKYYHYFSTREFVYNGEPMRNHNHLMEWYEGADGIKTGYIAASGFNLVASAKRDGRRLIGVVFGGQTAPQRDRQMARLLDAGFARNPGSPGMALADFPEQKAADARDDETADAAPPAPGADYRAVMQAMAASRAAAPHPSKIARASSRAEPEDSDDSAGDADEEDWGIQVGAYSSRTLARKSAEHASAQLGALVGDGEVSITRDHRKGPFRARIVGLDKDTAREACRKLARHHAACALVNPDRHIASR